MSIAVENYLKTAFQLNRAESSEAKLGEIAKRLNISNAAATDMAKKLSAKKLVHYTKYKELQLTEEGRKIALNVLRKHRLWETFLFKVFQMSLHEIHREAELLEHQTSDFLIEKMSEYLGNPLFDPHGDPIPTTDGDLPEIEGVELLSRTSEGEEYQVTRVIGVDEELNELLTVYSIEIGSVLKVTKQFNKSKITEIEIKNQKLVLNKDITEKIYVKQQTRNTK